MVRFYLTIDTELSADHFRRYGRAGLEANFAIAIAGETRAGAYGIGYQMDVLDAHGMKGVFFVDPLPALVFGGDVIKRIVQPILDRGHDVQLHAHSEWLAFAERSPVGVRTGDNLRDFCLADQIGILGLARDLLVDAGAPAPVAFRAGNYGANDDTLRALAAIGIGYDSSATPGIAHSPCRISLGSDRLEPIAHMGVIEVPIGAIGMASGRRHAQLTAISAGEILAALDHAARQGQHSFTLVSHGFELLSRQRGKANRVVVRRFERLCAGVARRDHVESATYAAHPPLVCGASAATVLPHGALRTGWRAAEQLLSNLLYGEKPTGGPWARRVAPAVREARRPVPSRQS